MTDRSYIFASDLMSMKTKGEQTKQFIIEKASEIFNRKGIAGTAMSDIMEATKLAKGSLYVHFENKEDLVNAAVDYNIELLVDLINKSLYGHKSEYDQLMAYIDTFLNPTDPLFGGGCPMMNFGTEADDTNLIVKKKIDKSILRVHGIIIDVIERGIKSNIFKKDWNYIDFATIAFAMIEGGIVICRIAGNNDKMKVINEYLKKIIEENTL